MKLFLLFAFLNNIFKVSASKECKTTLTGITRELKETFTPNIISFSVNVEELSSVTFYSGEFIYAIVFTYKSGLRRQYGDIIGNRVKVIRKIDLQNKKIMKYDFGFHNGKIYNLQLLLYDPLKNIHYWTAKLGKNKRDESLIVAQEFNVSSYVEYVSFEGRIDGESLRDWRMKYKRVVCTNFTTVTKPTVSTKNNPSTINATARTTTKQPPTTIKLMPTPDMFICKNPLNIPMMRSKKFGNSLSYKKIYEYTAPSVYYCSCSCTAGERFGTFFTCSIYEFNIKTRKCILYSMHDDYDEAYDKNFFFLNDYDHITGFTYLEGTSTITFTLTNVTKNGNNLGVAGVAVGATNAGVFSFGTIGFLLFKFKDKILGLLKCKKEDDEADEKEEEEETKDDSHATHKKHSKDDFEKLKDELRNKLENEREDGLRSLNMQNDENIQLLENDPRYNNFGMRQLNNFTRNPQIFKNSYNPQPKYSLNKNFYDV